MDTSIKRLVEKVNNLEKVIRLLSKCIDRKLLLETINDQCYRIEGPAWEQWTISDLEGGKKSCGYAGPDEDEFCDSCKAFSHVITLFTK